MNTIVVNRRIEAYDVYIGRGSIWGNPFEMGKFGDREKCIALYEAYIRNKILTEPKTYNIESLRGKRLGCYCKPLHCHGDVLVSILEETQA